MQLTLGNCWPFSKMGREDLLQQDVLVSQDSFHLAPVADIGADVTFHCNTGDYILLVYGRLPLDRAVDTGRLEIAGNRDQALLFNTLFQGV